MPRGQRPFSPVPPWRQNAQLEGSIPPDTDADGGTGYSVTRGPTHRINRGTPLPPQSWQPLMSPPFPQFFSFQECPINGIVQLVTFCHSLLSCSIIIWRVVQMVARLHQQFTPFCHWVLFHGMDGPQFHYSLKEDIWVVSIGVLETKLLWTLVYRFLCECKSSFLLDKCPGM